MRFGNSPTGDDLHYLYPNIVRNHVLCDQQPDEIEVGVAGRRVSNLDLLETTSNESLEEDGFLFDCHRVGEGLVSISQVCGQPDRRFREDFRRPLSVVELQRSVGLVLVRWVSAVEVGEPQARHSKGIRTASAWWVSGALDAGGAAEAEGFIKSESRPSHKVWTDR